MIDHVPGTDGTLVRAFRMARRVDRRLREKNPVGTKRWFIMGTEFEGEGALTPYANKERGRRRRERKTAHESRRRSRA